MTMRRIAFFLPVLLFAFLPCVAGAKPIKRKVIRRPPSAGAPASSPEQTGGDEAAPPEGNDNRTATEAPPPPEAAPARPAAASKPQQQQQETENAPTADSPPAPAGPSIDLQKLRADYDRLRDELFKTRSRAQLVQEGLYTSKLGGRIEWEAAPDYVIRHAEVRLDGGTIWDSGDKPVTDDVITVAERPCKPGPHAVTLRMEIRPGTKKKGKDIEGLGYVSEQTFAIVVPDGKNTTVVFTGDEDGSLPGYEPKIELELKSETIKK
jgi:hypothetical protein